jgi:hypothetical protein
MSTIIMNENKVDGIIKHLSDKNSAANFLRNHKIADVQSILDIREYDTYCDRKGLILDIKEENATDKCKIVIDVKSGQPSVEQVYDAIYTIGADCKKRILVFTGDRDYDDRDYLGANLEVVKNLLSEINSNKTELYLITAISITDEEFYIYDLIDAPCDDLGDAADPLPSQMEFLEEEFWQVFYIPLDGIIGNDWEPFLDGFLNYTGVGSHEPLGYVDAKLTWSESGLFFRVSDNARSQGNLKDIWSDKAHILKRLFSGCKMKFNDLSDNRSELAIPIWNLPISYLIGADRREKEFCAKFMKVSFNKLVMFFEYGIPDC